MKRLINPKTKEVAYIDLYTNTIHFSNSNTSHKAIIHKDPNTHKISKITTSCNSEPTPIPEPISELKSNSTSNDNKKTYKTPKATVINYTIIYNDLLKTPILYNNSSLTTSNLPSIDINHYPIISPHNIIPLTSSTSPHKLSA